MDTLHTLENVYISSPEPPECTVAPSSGWPTMSIRIPCQQSSLDHYHARQIHQSDDRRRRPVPPSAMLRRLSNGTVRLRPCSTCAVTRTAFTTALPTPITTGPANGLREQSAEQGNHSRMRSYGNHENSWDTRHNRSGRQKSHCTQVHLLVLNERMERLTLDPHHEILG
jgi:hypothetical protein